MDITPKIVFRTPFYEPNFQDFYTRAQLKEFLSEFDFMAPHRPSCLPTGTAEFQLGSQIEFDIDGYSLSSDIQWGPRFIVARHVKYDGKRILIESPVDSDMRRGMVSREYRYIPFHRGMADAVIELRKLRQLWPICENSRSEFIRFLTHVSRQRYKIRAR